MPNPWIILIIFVVLALLGVAIHHFSVPDDEEPTDKEDLGEWMESRRWDK